MEPQTIRQRRFNSLSARRKQKEEAGNTVYEIMNKESQRPESISSKKVRSPSIDSTTSSPRSSPEVNASSSVETFSDVSVTTPNGLLVMVSDMKQHKEAIDLISQPPRLQLTLPTMSLQEDQPSPRPVLASSLNKPSDFIFDKFTEIDDVEVFEVADAACSPIEVATPITYTRPNRPSMVSIFNILNKDTNKDAQKALPVRPDLPLRDPLRPTVSKRFSTNSARSGFMAGEATPFEIPDLPENALTMISNASQTDLSSSMQQQHSTLKKQKSTISLLSKAIKYGHSRMVSRAQSISQSPNQARPQSQHSMPPSKPIIAPAPKIPSTSSDRPLASLPPHTSARSISRPQTATASIGPPPVTALPPCPDSFPIPIRPSPVTKPSSSSLGHTSRTKSISNLRTRSDSIGNALMSMGRSKNRATTKEVTAPAKPPPLPPQPDTVADKTSIDLNAFPSPPPPSRPQSTAVPFSRPMRGSSMTLHGLGVTVN